MALARLNSAKLIVERICALDRFGEWLFQIAWERFEAVAAATRRGLDENP